MTPDETAAAERVRQASMSRLRVDFWWRQVGTDIEVRVTPDFMAPGPPWQHQEAPTGLLTIHLAGDPESVRPDPALDPLETPGPTIIRQADWDEETQTWKMPTLPQP
jgi:hypothetical protein